MTENTEPNNKKTIKTTPESTSKLHLLREIIIVIIGVLVALAADDWQEDRERDERDQQVLSMIMNELQTNTMKIKESGNYHDDMITKIDNSLKVLAEDNRFVTPDGWQDVNSVSTLNAAFDLALLSGTLSRIDAKLALKLSRLYDELKYFDQQRMQIGLTTLQTNFRDGSRYFRLKRVALLTEVTYKEKMEPLYQDAIAQMKKLGL